MRWIFDQLYFGDRLFCENLLNPDHMCTKHLSITIQIIDWVVDSDFRSYGHAMQFIGSYHVFFLLCHIVKEGPEKLRKFGFIASDFLVHLLYKV